MINSLYISNVSTCTIFNNRSLRKWGQSHPNKDFFVTVQQKNKQNSKIQLKGMLLVISADTTNTMTKN